MKYKINMTGTIENPDNGFRAGIDISVENGGNFQQVGEAVQDALDTLADHAVSPVTAGN